MSEATPQPLPDVRMRGFARRFSVDDAIAWLSQHAQRLEAEPVPLSDAFERILAEDVVSRVDVPGFDRAMMDGYAVRAVNTLGASAYNPLELRIIGEAMPGRPFEGTLGQSEAVRIMTGSPLPNGSDAVLPAERCEVHGERLSALDEVSPEKHTGRRGEDVSSGTMLLSAGRRLRPQDLGAISSIGQGEVRVVRRPKVRIIITGNELVPSGMMPSGHKIADANGPMLAALVRRDGGVPICEGLTPDDRAAISAAMAADADVTLVSGGSSVGQEDHAPQLLAELGELAIHGIAMRPSSPAGMGRIGRRLVFLLPGNPISCLCAYDFFSGRAIRFLGGRSPDWPYRSSRVPLRRKLVSMVGRVDYARVKLVENTIEPLAVSGASILTSAVRADGFVIIPSDSEGYPSGTEVQVYWY